MKKLIYSAVSASLLSVSVNAATFMSVEQNDGSIAKYNVENVSQVTFGDAAGSEAATVSGSHGLYTYVDLGLSIKWATCNVGALAPNQYGAFFRWAETNVADDYSKTNKYTDADGKYTKYVTDASQGTVDNKTVLERADDAAVANMGGAWRMPSKKEAMELLGNCTWVWIEDYNNTGVPGFMGTSAINGNTIFFPAAGIVNNGEVKSKGDYACLWTNTVSDFQAAKNLAAVFYFNQNNMSTGLPAEGRGAIHTVRAVYDPAAETNLESALDAANQQIANLNEQLDNCGGGAVLDLIKYNGYAHVDLGLPSGNVWSAANLGAEDEDGYGDFYAWGELEAKNDKSLFTKDNYRFYDNNAKAFTKYTEDDGKRTLQVADDAIRAVMGGSWKMPTEEDFQELIDNCTWKWIAIDGKKGALATGPNGNTIFFSVGGRMASGSGTNLYTDAFGYYWTKDLSNSSESYASIMRLGADNINNGKKKPSIQSEIRYYGVNIRAVCPK